jgi:hypothetical protein
MAIQVSLWPQAISWLRALLLVLLLLSFESGIIPLWQFISVMMNWSPRLGLAIALMALLSPIVLIAIAHHWLFRALEYVAPAHRLLPVDMGRGLLPSLMSWWEGLYGWLVGFLAVVIAFAILRMMMPEFDVLAYWLKSFAENQQLSGLVTAIRTFVAAYLYHFEFRVQHHLITLGASSDRET